MTNNEIAEVGEKMLDVLDTQGWCKNELQNHDGQVCLRGAMLLALTGKKDISLLEKHPAGFAEIDDLLAAQARLNFPERVHCAHVTLNNARSTTVEDVKLLIKRALIEPAL